MAARGELAASVAELRKVAGIWEGVSGVIDEAAGVAKGIALTPDQFSYAGAQLGLGAEYAKVHQMLMTFLQEGSDSAHAVAFALYASAQTYEGIEDQKQATFNGMAK